MHFCQRNTAYVSKSTLAANIVGLIKCPLIWLDWIHSNRQYWSHPGSAFVFSGRDGREEGLRERRKLYISIYIKLVWSQCVPTVVWPKKWRGKEKAMRSFTVCQRFIAVKTQCRQKPKQCQHSIPGQCNAVCRIEAAVNHWTFTETRLPFGNHSLQWFHTTQLQLEQGEGSSAWLNEGFKCGVMDINPRSSVTFLCVK